MKTAQEILQTYHPITHVTELKTDLWSDSTVLMAMHEYAAQFYTVDEVREIIKQVKNDATDRVVDAPYSSRCNIREINPDKYLTK